MLQEIGSRIMGQGLKPPMYLPRQAHESKQKSYQKYSQTGEFTSVFNTESLVVTLKYCAQFSQSSRKGSAHLPALNSVLDLWQLLTSKQKIRMV